MSHHEKYAKTGRSSKIDIGSVDKPLGSTIITPIDNIQTNDPKLPLTPSNPLETQDSDLLPLHPEDLTKIRLNRQRFHDYVTLGHDLTRQTRFISRTMLNSTSILCELPLYHPTGSNTPQSLTIPKRNQQFNDLSVLNHEHHQANQNRNDNDNNEHDIEQYSRYDTLPPPNYADLINFHPLADILVDDNDRQTLLLYRKIHHQHQQYQIDIEEYENNLEKLIIELNGGTFDPNSYEQIWKKNQQQNQNLQKSFSKNYSPPLIPPPPQTLTPSYLLTILGPPPTQPPPLPTKRIRFKQSRLPSHLLTQPHYEGLTLTPSLEEWLDPNQYIRKITIAHGYDNGIIRIIPPLNYQPPFSLDPDTTIFQTRTQSIGRFGTTGGNTIAGREWTLSSYYHATMLFDKVIDDYIDKHRRDLMVDYTAKNDGDDIYPNMNDTECGEGDEDENMNKKLHKISKLKKYEQIDELVFTQFPSPIPRRLKHLKDTILYAQKMHHTTTTASNIAQERIYLYQLEKQYELFLSNSPSSYSVADSIQSNKSLTEIYHQHAAVIEKLSRVHDISVHQFDANEFWDAFMQKHMLIEDNAIKTTIESMAQDVINKRLREGGYKTDGKDQNDEKIDFELNTKNKPTPQSTLPTIPSPSAQFSALHTPPRSGPSSTVGVNHSDTFVQPNIRFTSLDNKRISQPTLHSNSLLYTVPTRLEHLPTRRSPSSTVQIYSWQRYYARRLILLGFLFSLQQDTLSALSIQEYLPIMLQYLHGFKEGILDNGNLEKKTQGLGDGNNGKNDSNDSHNSNNTNNTNDYLSDLALNTHDIHKNDNIKTNNIPSGTLAQWAKVVSNIAGYYHISHGIAAIEQLVKTAEEIQSTKSSKFFKKRKLSQLSQVDETSEAGGVYNPIKSRKKNANFGNEISINNAIQNNGCVLVAKHLHCQTRKILSKMKRWDGIVKKAKRLIRKLRRKEKQQNLKTKNTPKFLHPSPPSTQSESLTQNSQNSVSQSFSQLLNVTKNEQQTQPIKKQKKYGMVDAINISDITNKPKNSKQLTPGNTSIHYLNPATTQTLTTTINYEIGIKSPLLENGKKNITIQREMEPTPFYGDLYPFDLFLTNRNTQTISESQFILSKFIIFLQYITQIFLLPDCSNPSDTSPSDNNNISNSHIFLSLFSDSITAALLQNSLLSPIPFPFPQLSPPKFHTTSEFNRLSALESIWSSAITYGLPNIHVEYGKDLAAFQYGAHPHPATSKEKQTNPYHQDSFVPTWNELLSRQQRQNSLLSDQVDVDSPLLLIQRPQQLPHSNATVLSEGWNPHVIAFLPGSLISPIGVINGITAPWAYFGTHMVSFPWHIEDDLLYSMSTNITSAPKVWYGISSSQADYFEELFSRFTALGRASLHSLSNILTPQLLAAFGIRTTRLVQEPGHIILTMSRGYHSGFSAGFSCAEAVNLAVTPWLPFGRFASMKYRYEANRESIFAIEMLIIRAVLTESHFHDYDILFNSLQEIIQDQQEIIAILFSHEYFLGISPTFQRLNNNNNNNNNNNLTGRHRTEKYTYDIRDLKHNNQYKPLTVPSRHLYDGQIASLFKQKKEEILSKRDGRRNKRQFSRIPLRDHYHHHGIAFETYSSDMELSLRPYHTINHDLIPLRIQPHQIVQISEETQPIFIPLEKISQDSGFEDLFQSDDQIGHLDPVDDDIHSILSNVELCPRGVESKIVYLTLGEFVIDKYNEFVQIYKNEYLFHLVKWMIYNNNSQGAVLNIDDGEIDIDGKKSRSIKRFSDTSLQNNIGDDDNNNNNNNNTRDMVDPDGEEKTTKSGSKNTKSRTGNKKSNLTLGKHPYISMDFASLQTNTARAKEDLAHLVELSQPLPQHSFGFYTTLNLVKKHKHIFPTSVLYPELLSELFFPRDQNSQQDNISTRILGDNDNSDIQDAQPLMFPSESWRFEPISPDFPDLLVKYQEITDLLSYSSIQFTLYPGVKCPIMATSDVPDVNNHSHRQETQIKPGLDHQQENKSPKLSKHHSPNFPEYPQLQISLDELQSWVTTNGIELPPHITVIDIHKAVLLTAAHPRLIFSNKTTPYASKTTVPYKRVSDLLISQNRNYRDDDNDDNDDNNHNNDTHQLLQRIDLVEKRVHSYTICYTPPVRVKLLNYHPLMVYLKNCIVTSQVPNSAHLNSITPLDSDIWVPECHICHQFCYNGFVFCGDQLIDQGVSIDTFTDLWTMQPHSFKTQLARIIVTCPYHSTTDTVCSCSTHVDQTFLRQVSYGNAGRNNNNCRDHNSKKSPKQPAKNAKNGKISPNSLPNCHERVIHLPVPIIDPDIEPTLEQKSQLRSIINGLNEPDIELPDQAVEFIDGIVNGEFDYSRGLPLLNHLVHEKTVYHACQNKYYVYRFDVEDLLLIKSFAFGDDEINDGEYEIDSDEGDYDE